MPREEPLPPSKEVKLADEITNSTKDFRNSLEVNELFSSLTSNDKIDYLVTYFLEKQAINNLIIEDLRERIVLLENS